MVTLSAHAESLDSWPSEDALELMQVQCVGQGYIQLQTLVALGADLEKLDIDKSTESDAGEGDSAGEEDSSPAIDLFSLSEKQLAELNFYQVLHLPYKPNLTADDVKKAYRKASLVYHPDKSGRGEEDAVFLKVKTAFETLSTQKQAYDSTEMPFDDSVPEENVADFFADFSAAFDRNLHFDARLLPSSGSKKNSKKGRKTRNSIQHSKPPSLGDEWTPIEQVHEFYDYWTHFSSWRDFSLKAARELETQEHLENAESRYEKRWYQKEIDRQAKKMKQQEQARITTLVERAMASDPRLIQERKRLIEEKEMKKKQREQEVLDKKRKEEEEKLADEKRIKEEKERKAQEKLQREKEKKMLRKAKQGFRRVVGEALKALLEPEHALDYPVDDICGTLNREQLLKLTERLEAISSDPSQVVQAVKKRAENLDEEDDENEPPTSNGTSVPTKEDTEAAQVSATSSASAPSKSNAKVPFTKEELSALTKGVKKYPPGGANRWDQIATYINNVCRPENPRTKEECIELYNQNKNAKAPPQAPTPEPAAETDGDAWSEEEDRLLQEGLAANPSTMDKNDRWSNIADCVPGKTKKQCVARFKAIRDAIKNKT